ncbi:IS21-like element helper ATPase IstB [Heliobacterium mobile]|nr:IS21-like element helper ATPase IstB [Heliobacterium mobile]
MVDMQLEHYLKRLKLPAMIRHAESIAREAEERGQSYLGFLKAVVEQEVIQREENQQKARITQANFPLLKTLESFDFTAIPSLNKQKVLALAHGDFMTKKENVICLGNSGTGKSHIATAIALSACQKGRRVRFTPVSALVDELLDAHQQHQLLRLEKKWSRFDLIVLDELGYIPFSRTGAELLFQFCSNRYEKTSLMVTSNLEFAEWNHVFGDEKLTAAFLDRLTHHAHILMMNGQSYRFRQSMRRIEKGNMQNS